MNRARWHLPRWAKLPVALGMAPAMSAPYLAAPAASVTGRASFPLQPSHAAGNLDCNGYSKIQRTILPPLACTDIRGGPGDNENVWAGRFYDNGHYVGHDEPDMTFFSTHKGSGNSVNWTETLPKDPSALPTVATPRKDGIHYI